MATGGPVPVGRTPANLLFAALAAILAQAAAARFLAVPAIAALIDRAGRARQRGRSIRRELGTGLHGSRTPARVTLLGGRRLDIERLARLLRSPGARAGAE